MTMSFDPLEFIKLGQQIAHPPTEARHRTAVGRAYYGVFLIARDKMGVRGRKKVHKRTVNRLRKTTGYDSTADQLTALRRLRNVADYDLIPAKKLSNWTRNWARAQRILSHILPKLQSLK